MNSMTQLNAEASYINYCYSRQCINTTQPPSNIRWECPTPELD